MLLPGPDHVRGDRFKVMRRFTLSSFPALNTQSEQHTELQIDSKIREPEGLSSSLRGAEYCVKEQDFSPDCGWGRLCRASTVKENFSSACIMAVSGN